MNIVRTSSLRAFGRSRPSATNILTDITHTHKKQSERWPRFFSSFYDTSRSQTIPNPALVIKPNHQRYENAFMSQQGIVDSRRMCSGYGPKWPSRLGRIKVRRSDRLSGTVDILEDNNEEKRSAKEIIEKVNTQIAGHSYGRLFAVVMMEKHQHKITAGDLLMCNHDIGASLGQIIRLDKSLLIGGKDFTLIGRPLLPRDAFRIVATVVEKNLSQHKICYKHKKAVKTNNPKTRWMRDYTTTLRINSIELLKPVDNTIDRTGFEPPMNKDPMSVL